MPRGCKGASRQDSGSYQQAGSRLRGYSERSPDGNLQCHSDLHARSNGKSSRWPESSNTLEVRQGKLNTATYHRTHLVPHSYSLKLAADHECKSMQYGDLRWNSCTVVQLLNLGNRLRPQRLKVCRSEPKEARPKKPSSSPEPLTHKHSEFRSLSPCKVMQGQCVLHWVPGHSPPLCTPAGLP